MHDTVAGRHPLHVAGANRPRVARAVGVRAFAFEHVGHGLEAAVRMVRRADGFVRRVGDRAELVEQEERIDEVEATGGEGSANGEAAALELLVGGDDAYDGSGDHGAEGKHRGAEASVTRGLGSPRRPARIVAEPLLHPEAIMATHSKGSATWAGDLMGGHGTVSAGNGAFTALPTTWAARAESRSTGTSPEELIAAAHASCFSMAFAGRLAKNGTTAERLDVAATVTFDKTDAGHRIVASALDVTGRVPGIDQATFAKIADDAKENCPVSQALKNNAKLTVSAKLA